MESVIEGAIDVVFSSRAVVSMSMNICIGTSYKYVLVLETKKLGKAMYTYFSSMHFAHMEINISQKSTGRPF